MRALILIALAAVLLVFGCAGNPGQQPAAPQNNSGQNISVPVQPPASGQNNTTQLANPASVNCVSKGYTLEIRKGANGGEVGYCVFGNGSECEEWAYFRGGCSENGTPARQPGKEGGFCGGIAALPCADGLECVLSGSYPDAGGKCVKQSSFSYCGPVRPASCTALNQPVCGRSGGSQSLYDYEDYSSACVACSKSSPASGYYSGTCAQNNMSAKAGNSDQLYYCPSDRAQACAQVNDSVCGRAVDATSSASYYRDYSSPCEACSTTSNAIAYYLGTCAGRKL